MTIEEAKLLVSRFTYKPGCQFRTWERYEGLDVILDAKVPDCKKPSTQRTITIFRHVDRWLLKGFEEEHILQTIGSIVRELELHEIDEWLRFEGKCIKNPHPEIE